MRRVGFNPITREMPIQGDESGFYSLTNQVKSKGNSAAVSLQKGESKQCLEAVS